MRDHAFVHSCFGIDSSCEFRISSFPQVHGSRPDPSGSARDPIGPSGTRKGPNGTPFGPGKDILFRLLPMPSPLITILPADPYVPSPQNHELQTFFSRAPSIAIPHFALFILYFAFPHNPQRPRSLLRGFPTFRRDPTPVMGRFRGDLGGASGAHWGRFSQPHPSLDKLTTHFQGNLYAWPPSTPSAPNIISSRRRYSSPCDKAESFLPARPLSDSFTHHVSHS